MKESVEDYAGTCLCRMKDTLEALVQIPSPSLKEQARAEYCLKWLEAHGVTGGYIDAWGSVVVAYPPVSREEKTTYSCLFLAHLDTVFSEDTELIIRKEEDLWRCPGIGDDTANAVVLMELIRYLFTQKPQISKPFLFGLNTGEEGLGNLKGSRGILEAYAGQIQKVVVFDLYHTHLYTDCVGSIRYKVEVNTKGGHSWMDFGNGNAIERMAAILKELYAYEPSGNKKTTYNVGVIEGGTSVNTIAAKGSFLFEFRSESAEEMERGDEYLKKVLDRYRCEETEISCTVVGQRPCSRHVDLQKQNRLISICWKIMEEVTGKAPLEETASTDCNIPLSLGIPAVCMGLIDGGGAHTKEEWMRPSSMEKGLVMAIKTVQALEQEEASFRVIPPDRELTEVEKQEIYEILAACDGDFFPPLSSRAGTAEKHLTENSSRNPGVFDYYQELMTQKNFLWKQGNRTIAFMSFKPEYRCTYLSEFPRVCYLTTLCLLKEFRGKGLSMRIYRDVLAYLKKKDPDATPCLRTWSTNGPQIHLMKKLHFETVAVLKDDRGPGVDTIYFAKKDNVTA